MNNLKKTVVPRSSNPKWLDSRLTIPSPQAYDIYPVIFIECGIIFNGRAGFSPTDNYTNGTWEKITHTNGNPANGEVLYYMQNPSMPDFIHEQF